jgi:hypothetical protein
MYAVPPPPQFSRQTVRSEIEEATGQPLSMSDPLPDSLIAAAEASGLSPAELRLWIYQPKAHWSAAALTSWANAQRLSSYAIPCHECGDMIDDATAHLCAASEAEA